MPEETPQTLWLRQNHPFIKLPSFKQVVFCGCVIQCYNSCCGFCLNKWVRAQASSVSQQPKGLFVQTKKKDHSSTQLFFGIDLVIIWMNICISSGLRLSVDDLTDLGYSSLGLFPLEWSSTGQIRFHGVQRTTESILYYFGNTLVPSQWSAFQTFDGKWMDNR